MALIKGKQILSLVADKIIETSLKQFTSQTEKNVFNAKADTTLATAIRHGLMSLTDKDKLDKIAANANNYVHPATHSMDVLTETSTKKFVSGVEKALFADKYTKTEVDNFMSQINAGIEWKASVASFANLSQIYSSPSIGWIASVDNESGTAYRWNGTIWELFPLSMYIKATNILDGLMSKEDKTKLDAIASGANKYIHPEFHIASMITEDGTHRWTTDSEKAIWGAKASTSPATTVSDGLMTSSDKIKVNTFYGVGLRSIMVSPTGAGATIVDTLIKTDGTTTTHTKDMDKITLAVNGLIQTPGLDYSLTESAGNSIVITWVGRHFMLESDDEFVVTFLQDK